MTMNGHQYRMREYNDLYYLVGKAGTWAVAAAASLMTWHKRLGHVDPRRIVSTFDFGSAAGLLLKDARPDPKRTVNIRLPECEIQALLHEAVPVPKTRTSIEPTLPPAATSSTRT